MTLQHSPERVLSGKFPLPVAGNRKSPPRMQGCRRQHRQTDTQDSQPELPQRLPSPPSLFQLNWKSCQGGESLDSSTSLYKIHPAPLCLAVNTSLLLRLPPLLFPPCQQKQHLVSPAPRAAFVMTDIPCFMSCLRNLAYKPEEGCHGSLFNAVGMDFLPVFFYAQGLGDCRCTHACV